MSPRELRNLSRLLLAWYRTHGRSLPWREAPDPYRVVVAEAMLQQTRAEVAARYFERFLAAFPSFQALAEAPPEEVLRLWEGLGYYRRARLLQELARIVVERFGGELPADPEELRRLPGVGPYTAGAIRVFAFRQPAAPIDANVRRLFARFRPEEDINHLVPALLAEDPFELGQALMDLGALVCRPRRPLCPECPWREHCATRGEGPPRPAPPSRRSEAVTVAVVTEGERVLAGPRTRGVLRHLWGLPMAPEDDISAFLARGTALGRFRHVFSHVVWQVEVIAAPYAGEEVDPRFRFLDAATLARLPFGRPFRRALILWSDARRALARDGRRG